MNILKYLVNLLPLGLYLNLRRGVHQTKHTSQHHKSMIQREETKGGYSYKPFIDTKSIFIHIPKCAGVSVNNALYGNLAGGHLMLSQYVYIFTAAELQTYFKFTVVRNPWDRLVSAFHFLKKGGMNESDKRWAEDNLKGIDDFSTFVKGWLTRDKVDSYYHFIPQWKYFLHVHKDLKVDYFAFLENLDEDFHYIAKKIGATTSLSASNKSKHHDYKDYYDDEMISIVAEIYKEDIELLGYSFDNTSLPRQIMERNEKHNFPYSNAYGKLN